MNRGQVKVNIVSLNGYSHCSMKGCKGQYEKGVEQKVHYLKVDAHFPQIDERNDHEINQSNAALIKVFEVNIRTQAEFSAPIIGQFIEGENVLVKGRDGDWIQVENKERAGWVHRGSLAFNPEIQHQQQLKGETHASYICDKCTVKIDWRDLYQQEIEVKQEGHVISNYTFDYTEMALAMEQEIELQNGEVDAQSLKNRILEEIESGHHGLPNRFNCDHVVNYLLRHRTAC